MLGRYSRLLTAMLFVLATIYACESPMPPAELGSHLEREFQRRYIAPYVAGDIETWIRVFSEDAVALQDRKSVV